MNIALLAETFNRAKTENGGLTRMGLRFYERLFEKYPQVRPLFSTPPEEQHKKLMASLAAIIAAVTEPEKLMPYLKAMGVRHVAYGTEDGHYGAVAENLIAVLKEHLSVEGEWTPEMEQSWGEALQTVAGVMIQAANNPEEAKAELMAAGYLPNGFRTDNPTPWVLAAV